MTFILTQYGFICCFFSGPFIYVVIFIVIFLLRLVMVSIFASTYRCLYAFTSCRFKVCLQVWAYPVRLS